MHTRFENIVDSFYSECKKPHWIFIVSTLTLLGLFGIYNRMDPDLFARLAVGRLIENLGYVPTLDPFAFTPKKPIWIDHEWLSALFLYSIWEIGQEWAVVVARILFAVITAAILISTHNQSSRKPLPLLLVLSIIQIAHVWLSPLRSQAITYLCIAILLWAMVSYQRNKSLLPLIPLPLLFIPWANAHGGFVVGLGFLSLLAIGESLRNIRHAVAISALTALSVLVTALNPYGFWEYWDYIIEATTMPRPAIDEWNAVNIFSAYAIIPAILTFLTLRGVIRNYRCVPPSHLLIIVFSLYFGLRHNRLLPIYCMSLITVGAPLLYLGASTLKISLLDRLRRSLCITLIIFIPVLFYYSCMNFYSQPPLRYDGYPVDALSYLSKNRPGGALLIHFNHGSYAMWALPDTFQISMDGRYEELYPDSTVRLVHDALDPQNPDAPSIRDNLNPDFVLIETEYLKKAREYTIGWNPLYEDPMYTLLEKDLPQ